MRCVFTATLTNSWFSFLGPDSEVVRHAGDRTLHLPCNMCRCLTSPRGRSPASPSSTSRSPPCCPSCSGCRIPPSPAGRYAKRQTQFSQNCLQASLLCWAGPIVLDSVAAPARHSPYLAGRSPHRTCQERVSEVFYDRVGYVIRILSCKALRHVCML